MAKRASCNETQQHYIRLIDSEGEKRKKFTPRSLSRTLRCSHTVAVVAKTGTDKEEKVSGFTAANFDLFLFLELNPY